MKKIFRLASVLALTGIALMYTGCAKDYDADIKAINEDLASLQTGTITDQSKQITALQQQAAQLENLATQYGQTLTALQSAKADASTVTANRAEVLGKLSDLEVDVTGQIGQINNAINDLYDLIAAKADKSWVEQTFATKEALDNVEQILGGVKGRVDVIESTLQGLGVDLQEVTTTLGTVQATANKAAGDATQALGDIDAVKQSLENYYKKGEVTELLKAAVDKLQEQIDALDNNKESKTDAATTKQELEAADAQEIADRQDADTALKQELNDKIKVLQRYVTTLQKNATAVNDSIAAHNSRMADMQLALTALTAKVVGIDKAYQEADSALKKAYKDADDVVRGEIAKEKAALERKINDVNTALDTEIAAREGAIDAEALARAKEISDTAQKYQLKIDALNKAIETEGTERSKEIADCKLNLQKQIDTLDAHLTAEAKARQAEVAKEKQALEQKISNLNQELGQALKDSTSHEALARSQEIAKEKKALQDQIDTLNVHLANEIQARSQEIAKEKKALQDQIDTLGLNLDKEIAARKQALSDSLKVYNQKLTDAVNNLTDKQDSIRQQILDEIAARKHYADSIATALTDSLNKEIQNRIAAVDREIKNRRDSIMAVSDSLDRACQLIKANKMSIDDEINNRIKALSDSASTLRNYADSLKNYVAWGILEVGSRITSVSVFTPYGKDELNRYVMGNDSSLVLVTKFQIRPAKAVKDIEAKDLKLYYSYAKARGTKAVSSLNSADVTILSKDEANGVVEVKAIRLLDGNEYSFTDPAVKEQFYFALEVSAKDTVGDYKVMSEYSYPVYGKRFDLKDAFSVDPVTIRARRQLSSGNTFDYTLLADTTILKPFCYDAIYVAIKDDATSAEVNYSLDQAHQNFGIKFNVDKTVTVRTEHSSMLPSDSCVVLSPDANSGLATSIKFGNMPSTETTFKKFVGEKDTISFEPVINGVNALISYEYSLEIVKHTPGIVTKNFHVYWNYKSYSMGSAAHSYDTLHNDPSITAEPVSKNSQDWWSYANSISPRPTSMTLTPLSFAGANNDKFQLGYFTPGGDYTSDLYITNAKFATDKIQNYTDKLIKEDDSNRYEFTINVTIDSVPAPQVFNFTTLNAWSIKVSEDYTYCFPKEQMSTYFIGTASEVTPYLIAGLDDNYSYSDIFDQFNTPNFVVDTIIRTPATGAAYGVGKDSLTITYGSGSLINFTFKARTLMPSSSYEVRFHKKVFGIDYKYVLKFTTASSRLVLENTAYIKDAATTDSNRSTTLDRDLFSHFKGAQAVGRITKSSPWSTSDYKTYYSLEDIDVRQLFRVTPLCDLVPSDYKEYTVKIREVGNFSSGNVTVPDILNLKIASSGSDYVLDTIGSGKNFDIKWNTYCGRVVKIAADLLLKNDKGTIETVDADTFIVWTQAPVVLQTAQNVEKTKIPGEDLVFNLNQQVTVYGYENGALDTQHNVYNMGAADQIYDRYFSRNLSHSGDHSSFFDYDIDETNVTLDGKRLILNNGTDYTFDKTTAVLTIKKNNILGKLVIPVKVSMKYYLDYNHDTNNAYGVQTSTFTVTVKD